MTKRQLEILQHSLGVDQFAQTPKGFTPYTRNHFCAGVADEPDCLALIELGFMQLHRRTEAFPYLNCSVTDAGIQAMKEASPKPPKLSRSRRRYRDFLDAGSDMTFFEYIRTEKDRNALSR